MTRQEQIVEFINRRFPEESKWINGNCYYFAQILSIRFPELNLYYLPKEGHFVAGYREEYYNWTGKVELKETPIKFSDLEEVDPAYYTVILRDCII